MGKFIVTIDEDDEPVTNEFGLETHPTKIDWEYKPVVKKIKKGTKMHVVANSHHSHAYMNHHGFPFYGHSQTGYYGHRMPGMGGFRGGPPYYPGHRPAGPYYGGCDEDGYDPCAPDTSEIKNPEYMMDSKGIYAHPMNNTYLITNNGIYK